MPWKVGDVEEHKKGLSDKQKRQWVKVANSALGSCIADGGTDDECAPKAIRQANGVVGNQIPEMDVHQLVANSYDVRTENYMGETYIVVPVVMLVEGVHNGSGGKMLHTAQELGKRPEAWDGRPVCVNHPNEDGMFVSCNSPEFMQEITVGTLFNSDFDGRLISEAWLSESRLRQACPEVLFAIQMGEALEVSTGYFSDKEWKTGVWGTEKYEGIEHNYVPDHLAILIEHEGACSLADGCGLGVCSEGGEPLSVLGKEVIKGVIKNGYTVTKMTACESGYREVMDAIQLKLNSMDEPDRSYYLVDVFANEFVYEVIGAGVSALYKVGYAVNNGKVELNGEPQKVARDVTYVSAQQMNDEGGEEMGKDAKKKCEGCAEIVTALIANKLTRWTDADKDKLTALGEDLGAEHLSQMLPVVDETPEEKPEETPNAEADTTNNEEISVDALKGKLGLDDVVGLLKPEDKATFEYAKSLHNAEREQLIGNIVKFAEGAGYTAKDLEVKDTSELKKLSALAKRRDYSGMGGGGHHEVQGVKPMLHVIEANKKKAQ